MNAGSKQEVFLMITHKSRRPDVKHIAKVQLYKHRTLERACGPNWLQYPKDVSNHQFLPSCRDILISATIALKNQLRQFQLKNVC